MVLPGGAGAVPVPWSGTMERGFSAHRDGLEFYLKHGGMLNLQTKRGCNFKCIYCIYLYIEGKTFRFVPPENVAAEAAGLQKAGARFFFVTDSAFNRDYGHNAQVARAFMWNLDAYHFIRSNKETITAAMRAAIDDAGLQPSDIQYVNAHGTSTPKGDSGEVECLRRVFGKSLSEMPVSSHKRQIGHTLEAAAAIEGVLSIEAMINGFVFPTVNHIPDPDFEDVDVVPNHARRMAYHFFLSNAFGFGGTSCCVVFRGI